MQKYVLIIMSVLLSLHSWAQQPPLFAFTTTNSSGTLYGQAQVDGIPATANDWIAAFDATGICCGASALTINSGIAYINLVIYGDDVTTPTVDEGMSGNEDFTLKIYQLSTGLYIDYPSNNSLTYFSGWANTNGTPIPAFSNVNDVYNFLNTSLVTLNLNITLCENEAAVTLSGGQPSGGVYSGAGVSSGMFDPAISGAGNHVITYSINNDSAFAIATVIGLVDATLLTSGPFCDNENNIALNSVTNGGTYSGSGIMGNSFNPDVVGVGSFWITYTITDSNNCTQDKQTLVIVNAAPLVPQIIQNGSTLECPSTSLTYQWLDANMNNITGANVQTFSPTTNGDYYVVVSNTNCSATSNVFAYNATTTTIKDKMTLPLNISIYNNTIYLFADNILGQIELFDISGKLIYHKMGNEKSHYITKPLKKGLYLIKIKNKNFTTTNKIKL